MTSSDRVESVRDLNDNFIRCRDLMHKWDERTIQDTVTASTTGGVAREWERRITCERCKCSRVQKYEIDQYGVHRAASSYIYPPDYLMLSHPTSSDIRLEVLARAGYKVPKQVTP